ncbi:DUF4393 domain-containing protein [Lysinibacillus sp. NPDC093688]|uniref:DUF4393 domain-containing protein n=1 Tax=Lysinibacillus sp. NPDC093688 TaxID=3390577 RepID=UPI003D07DA64
MSDSNFLKDISQSIKVPADIAKAVVEPPAQQLGQSLADLFYIAFAPLTKKRAQIEQNIETFKNEIGAEISKIDPEKIVEPKLYVAGRILDSAKYYVEEEKLRNMFAKLIAASVNEDFKDSTLPAFVQVITDLSSLDAQNIVYLKSVHSPTTHTVAGKIRLDEVTETGFGSTIVENFIPFPDINTKNHRFYAASVDNLVRLGIIQIHHGFKFEDMEVHDELKKHALFLGLCEELKEIQEIHHLHLDKKIDIEHGMWTFTEFGKFFIDVCI